MGILMRKGGIGDVLPLDRRLLIGAPCGEQWRATTSVDALGYARNSPCRPALHSARAVDPVPQSGRCLPRPARDAGSVTVARSRAGVQVPFFSFGHDRIGTDVQHPCGVTNATCIESHLDNLLFDRRRLPRVVLIQEAGTTGTLVLAAAIPWLPLAGLAMADDVGPLTVGTVQDLEDHDATRSR